MAIEIEKRQKTVWQEPYNNSESTLAAAYFCARGKSFYYNQGENSFRLFEDSKGNFLVKSQTTDGTLTRTTFYQHQLLGVVTYKIYRHINIRSDKNPEVPI